VIAAPTASKPGNTYLEIFTAEWDITAEKDSTDWTCNKKCNFILSVTYSQISLTDSCDTNYSSNKNPIYTQDGITDDMEEAVSF